MVTSSVDLTQYVGKIQVAPYTDHRKKTALYYLGGKKFR